MAQQLTAEEKKRLLRDLLSDPTVAENAQPADSMLSSLVQPQDAQIAQKNAALQEVMGGTDTAAEWTRGTSGRPTLTMVGAPKQPGMTYEQQLNQQWMNDQDQLYRQAQERDLMSALSNPAGNIAQRTAAFEGIKRLRTQTPFGSAEVSPEDAVRLAQAEKYRAEAEKARRVEGADPAAKEKALFKMYQNMPEGEVKRAFGMQHGFATKPEKGAAKSGESTEIAQMGVDLIDRMIGKRNDKGQLLPESKTHPGFETYVGATMLPGLRFMEGSDTATFQGMEKQLTGQAMLEAYQQIRGTGAISNKEGESATMALNRMSKALNEDEYVKAALEFRNILDKGVRNVREGKFPYSNEVGTVPPPTDRQQQFRVLRSGG